MSVDIGLDIKQLAEIQKLSKELKSGFKRTESIPWTTSSFSAELYFQVTHVIHSLLNRNELGFCVLPLSGVDKGISDEIADVMFNIMNILNHLNLSISDVVSAETISQCSPLLEVSDPKIHAMNLAIQAGNLWDASFRNDGYKHIILKPEDNVLYIQKSLSGILIDLLILAKLVGVNVFESFIEMSKDASSFLTKYKII